MTIASLIIKDVPCQDNGSDCGCVTRDSNSTYHPSCIARAGVLTLSSGGHRVFVLEYVERFVLDLQRKTSRVHDINDYLNQKVQPTSKPPSPCSNTVRHALSCPAPPRPALTAARRAPAQKFQMWFDENTLGQAKRSDIKSVIEQLEQTPEQPPMTKPKVRLSIGMMDGSGNKCRNKWDDSTMLDYVVSGDPGAGDKELGLLAQEWKASRDLPDDVEVALFLPATAAGDTLDLTKDMCGNFLATRDRLEARLTQDGKPWERPKPPPLPPQPPKGGKRGSNRLLPKVNRPVTSSKELFAQWTCLHCGTEHSSVVAPTAERWEQEGCGSRGNSTCKPKFVEHTCVSCGELTEEANVFDAERWSEAGTCMSCPEPEKDKESAGADGAGGSEADLEMHELVLVQEGDPPVVAAVRDPTTWTMIRHDGPNHLGL